MLPLAMPRPLVESHILPSPVLPNLVLDFQNGVYQQALGGGDLAAIDFIAEAAVDRASTGSYYDSGGVLRTALANEARFDHTPSAGTPRGLMVEPSRTNELRYSGTLDNGVWIKANSSVLANVATAPDGSMTADKIVENSTNANHSVRQTITGSITAYTWSIFFKAAERTQARMDLFSSGVGTVAAAVFDLLAGSLIGGSGTIEDVGNGWFRCSVTGTVGGTTINGFAQPVFGGTGLYVGDGSSGVLVWGAQLEEGEHPSSYIATEATTVTRAEDHITLPWSHSTTGSYLLTAETRDNQLNQAIATIDGGNDDNKISWLFDGVGQASLSVVDGGSIQANLATALTSGKAGVIASRVALNDLAQSSDGSPVSTDNTATLPTISVLRFGRQSGGLALSGWIKGFTYWSDLLSDPKLVAQSSSS